MTARLPGVVITCFRPAKRPNQCRTTAGSAKPCPGGGSAVSGRLQKTSEQLYDQQCRAEQLQIRWMEQQKVRNKKRELLVLEIHGWMRPVPGSSRHDNDR
jgi:hypothetical protein